MKKILFIGNSHTYFNDMPQMVRELFACAEEPVSVTMLTHGGMTLDWHCKQEQTAFNLRFGGYDYCVLQQAAHPFDGYQALSDGVREIRGLAGENPPRFVLYMTWAEKAKPENQPEMTEAYRRTAAEQGTLLAPAGEMWKKFRSLYPDIDLYFTDGAHASYAGSMMAACAVFSTIFRQAPPLKLSPEAVVLNRIPAEISGKILDFCVQFPAEGFCDNI